MISNKIFTKIWHLNISTHRKNKYLKIRKIPKIIAKNLLPLLLSDGSCSRNLTAVEGIYTYVELYNQEILSTCIYDLTNTWYNHYLHRRVWLVNNNTDKIAFAESNWKLYNNLYDILYAYNQEPIGKIFIHKERDINRNLQSIYCGYSTQLNYELNNSGLLWGRSYNITFEDQTIIFIHELFSSSLLENL